MAASASSEVDISDLMIVDNRLPFRWRKASVTGGQLHMSFPSPLYSIDTHRSTTDGDTWKLCIVKQSGMGLTVIRKQSVAIPDGVTKIVIGQVHTH